MFFESILCMKLAIEYMGLSTDEIMYLNVKPGLWILGNPCCLIGLDLRFRETDLESISFYK